MKNLTLLGALLPLAVLAQPITNPTNNPNLPDYRNPSQQRMQTQMQTQQNLQRDMLNQQLQTQNRQQQQNLQTQMNTNSQRVRQGEMQPLPSQNQPNPPGGLLNGSNNTSSGLQNRTPQKPMGGAATMPGTQPATPAPMDSNSTP